MYGALIASAIAAWFVGFVLDVNVGSDVPAMMNLRLLFPMITVGICIIKAIKDKD